MTGINRLILGTAIGIGVIDIIPAKLEARAGFDVVRDGSLSGSDADPITSRKLLKGRTIRIAEPPQGL